MEIKSDITRANITKQLGILEWVKSGHRSEVIALSWRKLIFHQRQATVREGSLNIKGWFGMGKM